MRPDEIKLKDGRIARVNHEGLVWTWEPGYGQRTLATGLAAMKFLAENAPKGPRRARLMNGIYYRLAPLVEKIRRTEKYEQMCRMTRPKGSERDRRVQEEQTA